MKFLRLPGQGFFIVFVQNRFWGVGKPQEFRGKHKLRGSWLFNKTEAQGSAV